MCCQYKTLSKRQKSKHFCVVLSTPLVKNHKAYFVKADKLSFNTLTMTGHHKPLPARKK